MLKSGKNRILLSILTVLAFGGHANAQQLLPGEQEVNITAIEGVVADGAEWELVWADFYTADGITATADGGVLFAQEQTDTIRKLDINHQEYIYAENTNGAGSISFDKEGRLFAVQRTCTETMNSELPGCNELTRVAILTPTYTLIANSFPNGEPMGRLNDLITDGRGGAYFTSGGAYHVNAQGHVSTVEDENIGSNGIMLNADGSILYVTNRDEVLAFDVAADGSTSNRRVFGGLDGDGGGDGMAIDSEGRLYVTANAGVHVLSEEGDYLGVIPVPRRAITLAFSGPDKKTLYVPAMGVVGPDGNAWTTPEGIRNAAMTIYTLDMESQGFLGRAK
jgi:gluconolactonase